MGGRTENLQQIGWTFVCVTEPKFELRALTGNMVFPLEHVVQI